MRRVLNYAKYFLMMFWFFGCFFLFALDHHISFHYLWLILCIVMSELVLQIWKQIKWILSWTEQERLALSLPLSERKKKRLNLFQIEKCVAVIRKKTKKKPLRVGSFGASIFLITYHWWNEQDFGFVFLLLTRQIDVS